MSENEDGATADDETPRGAPKPAELDGREYGDENDTEAEAETGIPPEVREEEDDDDDDDEEAREIANPDQHRDEEAYD